MKKIYSFFAVTLMMLFCIGYTVFADGDPNIDGGGGGLSDGTKQNYWNPGNDGVRVTAVNSQTGLPESASVDYCNGDHTDIRFHFGKVSKADYLNGKELKVNTGTYVHKKPGQPLPAIISDGVSIFPDISMVRSYFTDEQVIRSIAGDIGITYSKLISGKYKLMIEPIMYITYDGIKTAMTATESSLYNQKTGGDVGRKFGPLSHKNLPFAIFLEKDDLGYTAWTGATDIKVSDSDIISNLGVGLVSFKDYFEPPEVEVSDYSYRTSTYVYTAVTVSGGEHTPDNPVKVVFKIKNRKYTVNNVVYPEGSSQLVWIKWRTPSTPQDIDISVTVSDDAGVTTDTIKARISKFEDNPPPDPTAYDRNDDFTAISPILKAQKTSLRWSQWTCDWKSKWEWQSNWVWQGGKWVDKGKWVDNGNWEFVNNSYNASISAKMSLQPDSKNPTAMGGYYMKSGYGVNATVMTTVSGNGEHTDVQNVVTYFPEFDYATYWRLLQLTGDNKFEFRENKYSTYKVRAHYTPVWYPDGKYRIHAWVFDCWCPAGMLSLNKTNNLEIEGNVFDDWHIAPTN